MPLEALEITLRWSTEGLWIPEAVRGRLSTEQGRETLGSVLETELGIPAQRQEWEIWNEREGPSEEA